MEQERGEGDDAKVLLILMPHLMKYRRGRMPEQTQNAQTIGQASRRHSARAASSEAGQASRVRGTVFTEATTGAKRGYGDPRIFKAHSLLGRS